MQVSNVQDHVTHAVIGGAKTIEFGISSSAEFFNILSSTLYSDQILAVVREVLCNAWDAHIAAGCTDKPVEVTLTKEKIIVKDFGLGIPHDKIGEVYCTYGNSTKQNDGKQTGGFGLGCKAPFAYVDHFDVTSSNNGTATLYAVSKSSAQAMGKPGATPITSFPSTSSGLTVELKIKEADFTRFDALIKRIAHNGDMKVSLNGSLLDTLNFPADKAYLVGTEVLHPKVTPGSKIAVRYGNVVYPVDVDNAAIKAICSEVLTLLRTMGGGRGSLFLIFQAPPHSIAVTPSRESLSMQEHTVDTLIKLFTVFLKEVPTRFNAACSEVISGLIKKCIQTKVLNSLLGADQDFPASTEAIGLAPKNKPILATFAEMAAYRFWWGYPEDYQFRKQDVIKRVKEADAANLLSKRLVAPFLKTLENAHSYHRHAYTSRFVGSDWMQRWVVAPAVKKVLSDATKLLSVNSLYVHGVERDIFCKSTSYSGVTNLVPVRKAGLVHPVKGLPFLRNLLIVTANKSDFADRAAKHDLVKAYGNLPGYMVYHVKRKKGEAEAAVECFTKAGYTVVDLTVRYDFDPKVERATPVARKPKKKGWPLLSASLGASGNNIYVSECFAESAAHTETPEFVVHVEDRSGARSAILNLGSTNSARIVKLFGERGCAVKTTVQYKKAMEAGAVPFKDWLTKEVVGYLENSPTIKEHLPYALSSMDELIESGHFDLAQLIWRNKDLRAAFKIVDNRTEKDHQYLEVLEIIRKATALVTEAAVEFNGKMAEVTPAKELVDLAEKINNNPLLDILSSWELESKLKSTDPKISKRTADLFVSVLSG